MRVSFYLPPQYMPSAEKQRAWLAGEQVSLEESGKIACAQCWIFQTWAILQRAGCPTDLVHEMPPEGIVVSITGCLPEGFRAPRGLFVAGVVADGLPHPGTHIHIVQNSAHARRLPHSVFMPLWPQPNIVARDPARGDAFERVAFFGDRENLAAELLDPDWQDRLQGETGAVLEIRGAGRWHDYSDIDAVVAVREFSSRRQLHKPATKLYNAWLAGVPFVGGNDSAYSSDGHPGQDYLVVRSPNEVLFALRRLKDDPSLRGNLVAQGKKTSRAFTLEAITERWRSLLTKDLPGRTGKQSRMSDLYLRCDRQVRKLVCLLDRTFRD